MDFGRQDVVEVASQHVTATVAERLGELARPAIRLISDGPARSPTASKGGGRPALPPGEAWPSHEPSGTPCVFLLQVRLGELPDLGELPRAGLLSVAVGWDASCGNMEGPAWARILPDGVPLEAVEPPDGLTEDELPEGVLDEMALRPEVVWTIPTAASLRRLTPGLATAEDRWGDLELKDYGGDLPCQVAAAVRDAQGPVQVQAQLLGWPGRGSQGGDAGLDLARRALGDWNADVDPWRVLVEIPSARLVPSFGDGGEGCLCLPEEDLRAARFARLESTCETN